MHLWVWYPHKTQGESFVSFFLLLFQRFIIILYFQNTFYYVFLKFFWKVFSPSLPDLFLLAYLVTLPCLLILLLYLIIISFYLTLLSYFVTLPFYLTLLLTFLPYLFTSPFFHTLLLYLVTLPFTIPCHLTLLPYLLNLPCCLNLLPYLCTLPCLPFFTLGIINQFPYDDLLCLFQNNIEIVSDWIPNEVYSARIRWMPWKMS